MRYQMIRYNTDFSRAYRKGKSYVHPQVVLYVNKNRAKTTRVGITCSKKVGNAVVRNRARRVIKHALWQVMEPQVGHYDIILVARRQTPALKSTQLAKTLKTLLLNAGIKVREEDRQ